MMRGARHRVRLRRLLAKPALVATLSLCAFDATGAESPPTPPKEVAKHAAPAVGTPPKKAISPPARSADLHMRRSIAGGATQSDVESGVLSPELRAIRDAEKELFPPAAGKVGSEWPVDIQLPHSATSRFPHIDLSGLPRGAEWSERVTTDGADAPADHAWLDQLKMPDIPVRFSPRLLRYLDFFKNDPRGRSSFAAIYKRSGRYRTMLVDTLRSKGVPEDLVWVTFVESGFDPYARSFAGAEGMWQLMPGTAKIYGLTVNRWLDERMAPARSTEAAVEFLSDMQRRFGNWDLALAGYHMGYGGIASVMRRNNTNDFWTLAEIEGALPWLTTLYVPKILAIAVIARNLGTFGFADLEVDPPIVSDEIEVPPATSLASVASASGCSTKDIEALNPELRAGRTPPASPDGPPLTVVRVPKGHGTATARALAAALHDPAALERYVVRFGETLGEVATAHGTTSAKLIQLNAIGANEVVRGGTVLLVPHGHPTAAGPAKGPATKDEKSTLLVPSDIFLYPDRKRVFYRVIVGDSLDELAPALGVSVEELSRWNTLDPSARLIEGMTLQAYVPEGTDLSRIAVEEESTVHPVPIGSEEFFAQVEAHRGKRRILVAAHKGDTLDSIGKRYGIPAHIMERINRRERGFHLEEGESVVLYVSPNAAVETDDSSKVPPLSAPIPEALPPLHQASR